MSTGLTLFAPLAANFIWNTPSQVIPTKSDLGRETEVHSPETYGTSTRNSAVPEALFIGLTCKKVAAGSAAVQTSKFKNSIPERSVVISSVP